MFKLDVLRSSYPNYSFNIVFNDSVIFEGATMCENEMLDCFKPWQTVNIIIEKHGLQCNALNSYWLTQNCYVLKFTNSAEELIMRFDSKLIELFSGKGETIEAIEY